MGLLQFPEICLAIICFLVTYYFTKRRVRWSWPLLGTLPTVLLNIERIHDISVYALRRTNSTLLCKGPWFANMDIMVTVDPANVHYIMTSNFANYPKGARFRHIFDILGDGIFNSDGELWQLHRKITRSLICNRKFVKCVASATRAKVERGLVGILEHASKKNLVLDMQDLFQRLTFDTTCMAVTGHDPGCLSVDLPDMAFSRALDEAEEVIAYRHVLPETMWKLQRWLGFGQEKKLSLAWKTLDHFIYDIISKKRHKLRSGKLQTPNESAEGVDLLTSYMQMEGEILTSGVVVNNDKFLRDNVLNLMIAGRDTTSSALTWLLWLIARNPEVEEKLREELRTLTLPSKAYEWHVFQVEETNKLVYLHAALLETLRLYPPVPFQHKSPIEPNILPSGHHVHPQMKILFPLYAMGRMRTIWGENASKFRPERWVSEQGKIKHEPAYKFVAFNAGPRICLGKEVAITQIKMIAATLIHNFQFRVLEDHKIYPDVSVILHMKHGLKVKVNKRWI